VGGGTERGPNAGRTEVVRHTSCSAHTCTTQGACIQHNAPCSIAQTKGEQIGEGPPGMRVPGMVVRPARCWTTHTGDLDTPSTRDTSCVPQSRKGHNLQPGPHHARRRGAGRAAHLVHSSHQASNVHRAPLTLGDVGPSHPTGGARWKSCHGVTSVCPSCAPRTVGRHTQGTLTRPPPGTHHVCRSPARDITYSLGPTTQGGVVQGELCT
jgi:hypothetical protein